MYMNKNMLRGVVCLSILLVLYLLVAFLIPFAHTAVFWVSLVFTLIAFGMTAFAFYIAFLRHPDAKSRFYGFPIARLGTIYGVIQLILGLLFMALGTIVPVWLAVLVYAILLGAAAIGLISAEAVVEHIQTQDVKLKKDVALMQALQAKLQQIVVQCDGSDETRDVQNLADELRFSDPVSSDTTRETETDLNALTDELQKAVLDGDTLAAKDLCKRCIALLSERNRLCKLGKGKA